MLAALLLLHTAPEPLEAVYIGHSLASDVPDFVMALATPERFTFKEQFIPGSPLRWHWEETTRTEKAGQDHFRGSYDKIITAQTDLLVIIDSVPRGEAPSLDESVDYTARFLKFARAKNPQIQLYWYTPWHHITSGTPQASEYDKASPNRQLKFRERLDADHKLWQQVVTRVNQANPGPKPVKLLAADLALARLADQAAAGKVPGLASINDLFGDDIHLTPLGRYFIGCVHYAVIFNQSPVGKPYDVKNRWGQPYYGTPDWTGKTWTKPDPKTAQALQTIAWESVSKP